jgi:anaerobic ribonucleoside-triphosphate reductase activating protein
MGIDGQGGCIGCWNAATHSTTGGYEIEPEELAEYIIRKASPNTEGITISGGEPMQQALSVYRLICMVKALKPHWTVGMFSGYTLSELMRGDYDLRETHESMARWFDYQHFRSTVWDHQIKDRLDFAVLGRYDYTRPTLDITNRPYLRMCSSANQTLFIFSRRYQYADFPALPVEFTIESDGLTTISGFPTTQGATK